MTDQPHDDAAERWKRARAIFDDVVELAPGAREAALAAACSGDQRLRAEVEALLAANDQDGGFLDRPAGDVAAALIEKMTADRLAGRRIGNYRLLRKLGEGGMGIVFEAEQDTPRRLVALKLIRGGVSLDEASIRLFQREAESLGLLKHSSIAVIYESGQTADGQHFLAMELVDGVPLDAFLRERSPGAGNRNEVRFRLAIFLHICEAIAHAHERGVIHRDLKPSNILVLAVDGEGVPAIKILDFGLARITRADVTLPDLATSSGQVKGTLAYMSPEQARGDTERIDARSDIYALGVLLYEMLVGRLPYNVSRPALHESVRVICEEDPVRPGAVERMLRGDVETILLKALEKEPARRYQDATALADDVIRFLADKPILARPPSSIYQVSKFVVRHRRVTAVVAGVFALLLLFGVAMTIMFGRQRQERLRAEAQRARAEQEAQKAQRTREFVSDMLSSVDPTRAKGEEVTVREVLDKSSRRIESELADQPEVAASIRATIGSTYQALGLYDEAELHLRAALATRESVLAGDHDDIASSLQDLGSHLMLNGDYDGARPLMESSIAMRERLHGEADAAMATSLSELASIHAYTEDYRGADSLMQETLAIQRRVLAADDIAIATTLSNLGNIAIHQGDPARAEPFLRESLALYRRILGNDHPDVAEVASGLAALLLQIEDNLGAEALYRESLASLRKSYGDEHPKVARTISALAVSLTRLGRHEEAETLQREALAMRRKLLGDDHPDVASSLHHVANALMRRGELPAAERMFGEALRIRRAKLPATSWLIALAENDLGACLMEMGRYGEAGPLLVSSRDHLGSAVGPSERQKEKARERVAALEGKLGRPVPGGSATR